MQHINSIHGTICSILLVAIALETCRNRTGYMLLLAVWGSIEIQISLDTFRLIHQLARSASDEKSVIYNSTWNRFYSAHHQPRRRHQKRLNQDHFSGRSKKKPSTKMELPGRRWQSTLHANQLHHINLATTKHRSAFKSIKRLVVCATHRSSQGMLRQ